MRLFIAMLLALCWPLARASAVSEALFAAHRGSVFQIRLVDISANEKTSLGSGFRVGPDGMVATNYHVISDGVYEPDRYRIEAVDDSKIRHTMHLRAIDIVHDIALLAFEQGDAPRLPSYTALPVNTGDMLQGESVFSLGNPHDIGMMIVAGEYNGPVKDSRFMRMIFSGNINSGMSGGPAINSKGELIGINVASSGNGIGYLVPARYLQQLLDDFPQQDPDKLTAVATRQLLADQQAFYSGILSAPWPTRDFAQVRLPQELHPSIKCWGKSDAEKNRRYDASSMQCSNGSDYLYIQPGKYLGLIEYHYQYVQSLDLDRFQLYALAEAGNTFDSDAFSTYNRYWKKQDVTPYNCKTAFVDNGGGHWRTVYCVRHYKLFPGLHDIGLLVTSVDYNDRFLGVEMTAAGISSDNAGKLADTFIRNVTWKK